jgi:hypothetical protein
MRGRKVIKQKLASKRNAKRVWNHIVAKLSSKSIEPEAHEEDEWDRYDRHMKPIREAQKHNDY